MKQEKKGNKFEKTIASGALWWNKGDIRYGDYCIECKFTEKKGFRVSKQILEKLWNDSLDASKEPLLIIGIDRNDNEMFVVEGRVTVRKK